MISIGGTLGLMILLIIIGKHKKSIGILTYFAIALVAMIQVGVVLYSMYTMAKPGP